MKKAQLTAVIVLVVVAIVVAAQAFAGWGGGRWAGRGPINEQGGLAYPERGPMDFGGPGLEAPGPEWGRRAPGPVEQGGGPQWGRRPNARTPQFRGDAGRSYGFCPHCGARLNTGPGVRDGFGPRRGRGPRLGAGVGQGFRQGQWGPRQRNLGRGDIFERRRLPADGREQGPPRPYGGEQGFRRGGVPRPDWNRMDNWGPPQRRGMNRPGPHGFRPIRPEEGEQSWPPGPPQGRRWFRPQGTPENQPQQPPQENPPVDAPADNGGPQAE